jgi:hypothetical protein
MVYLEIVTVHLPCPLCWDCTAENTLSTLLGLYSRNVPTIGIVQWAVKLLGGSQKGAKDLTYLR